MVNQRLVVHLGGRDVRRAREGGDEGGSVTDALLETAVRAAPCFLSMVAMFRFIVSMSFFTSATFRKNSFMKGDCPFPPPVGSSSSSSCEVSHRQNRFRSVYRVQLGCSM